MLVKSAEEIYFRCSQISKIMTNPVGKSLKQKKEEAVLQLPLLQKEYDLIPNKALKSAIAKNEKIQKLKAEIMLFSSELGKGEINLSEGAKTHLLDVWNEVRYGRTKDIKSKYLKKGNTNEDSSFDMILKRYNVFLTKNIERFYNDFIQGEPDAFTGAEALRADIIYDVKNPYGLDTFSKNRVGEINPAYWWQGQGYMDLLGCEKYRLVYTLTNTPEELYEKEKTSLWYELGCPDRESDYFYEAESQLRKRHFFDDIPLDERIIQIEFDRDDNAINAMHRRVEECREYMQVEFFDKPRFGFERQAQSIYSA